jgi:hypothetical protein
MININLTFSEKGVKWYYKRKCYLDDVLPVLLHDESLLEVGHLVDDGLLGRLLQHHRHVSPLLT